MLTLSISSSRKEVVADKPVRERSLFCILQPAFRFACTLLSYSAYSSMTSLVPGGSRHSEYETSDGFPNLPGRTVVLASVVP